ncbi:MAG: hypothetical protein WEF28_02925, partial [Acidimicrobiia bacterium]
MNHDSGRVIGPDGVPDKDAVVFNLGDGRVALLHRVHPNVQLAIFDLIAEPFDPGDVYWDRHMATLGEHVILGVSGHQVGDTRLIGGR